MRAVLAVLVLMWFTGAPLFASECPGNPDALGTSRTLAVSPTDYPRVGSMQYDQTLPLDDLEVVLTFDDGSSISLHKSRTGHLESAVRPGDLLYRWANGGQLSALAAPHS